MQRSVLLGAITVGMLLLVACGKGPAAPNAKSKAASTAAAPTAVSAAECQKVKDRVWESSTRGIPAEALKTMPDKATITSIIDCNDAAMIKTYQKCLDTETEENDLGTCLETSS